MDQLDLTSLNIADVIVDPRAGIVPALMLVGWIMKQSATPNRLIPWVLAALGIGAGEAFFAQSAGYVGAGLIGLLYAGLAIGAHSGVKNAAQTK